MDGVLCDFDLGVRKLSGGLAADALPPPVMWSLIHDKADRFYEHLEWTPDGYRLWQHLLPLQPDILTGVANHASCPQEKYRWCLRELGIPQDSINHVDMAGRGRKHQTVMGRKKEGAVNVITCWSKNKHFESGKNCVLIDDRIRLKADWVAKGGIFVHHTSTENTLRQLRELGILNGEPTTIMNHADEPLELVGTGGPPPSTIENRTLANVP